MWPGGWVSVEQPIAGDELRAIKRRLARHRAQVQKVLLGGGTFVARVRALPPGFTLKPCPDR